MDISYRHIKGKGLEGKGVGSKLLWFGLSDAHDFSRDLSNKFQENWWQTLEEHQHLLHIYCVRAYPGTLPTLKSSYLQICMKKN